MGTTGLIHGHQAITAPEGVPTLEVDPYDQENLTARTYFRPLRECGPFAYIPKYSVLACGGYQVTKEVFSDHTRFVSSRGVGLADFGLEEPWRPASIILEVDPPAHTQTRRVITRALSAKVVRDLTDAFDDYAGRLIDRVLAKGEVEAIADIAEAFPTKVFPEAVGLKEPDPKLLIEFGSIVFNAIGPDNGLRTRAMERNQVVMPRVMESCAREKLTADGIGSLFYSAADAGEITEHEAGMLVRSLLSAGVDTTVTGIGSALWCLANHPNEFAKLKSDPDRFALAAFEETLRLTSPVQAFYRTVAVDTEVAGIKIKQGSKILCVLGAANMDPDHWRNPEVFDISRDSAGHLALGAGIHFCVGRNIARAEGAAILRALAERVDTIEPVGAAVWRANNSVHGLERLPLKLS